MAESTEQFLAQKLKLLESSILKEKYSIQMAVATDCDVHEEYLANRLVYRLNAYIWREELDNKIISMPATWWDHFKLDNFPASWLKKWPVTYTTHTFSFSVMYPEFCSPPSMGQTRKIVRYVK